MTRSFLGHNLVLPSPQTRRLSGAPRSADRAVLTPDGCPTAKRESGLEEGWGAGLGDRPDRLSAIGWSRQRRKLTGRAEHADNGNLIDGEAGEGQHLWLDDAVVVAAVLESIDVEGLERGRIRRGHQQDEQHAEKAMHRSADEGAKNWRHRLSPSLNQTGAACQGTTHRVGKRSKSLPAADRWIWPVKATPSTAGLAPPDLARPSG
jgi:hypothetical protein